MSGWLNSFAEGGTTCWACPVFDNLFVIISDTAARAYEQLSAFGVIVFGILFAFYAINTFWQNMKSGMNDPFFQKSLKPVLIKAVTVLSLLTLGLSVPRLISKVTFEPVTVVTMEYTKNMLPEKYKIKTDYTPIQMDNQSFFNPELKDSMLQLIQTSITNFQVFIKTGIAMIDSIFVIVHSQMDFAWFYKRLIVFLLGLYLTYYFVKIFIKYSFCFMDIIVAMAMFSFFFPLSLVFFVFQGATNLPDWMKSLGKNLGSSQLKNLINAIISVAASILTYTIILLIIHGYLNGNGVNMETIQNSTDSLLNFDLDNPSAIQVTFLGSSVLLFMVNYLAKQLPKITQEIMNTLGLKQNTSVSDKIGEDTWQLTELVKEQTKKVVKNRFAPEDAATKTTGETAADKK